MLLNGQKNFSENIWRSGSSWLVSFLVSGWKLKVLDNAIQQMSLTFMLDLEAPLVNGTFDRVHLSLLDAAMELQEVEKTRCLNALSIPLLHPPTCVAGLAELCKLRQALCFLN
jgi:hypothetical protein